MNGELVGSCPAEKFELASAIVRFRYVLKRIFQPRLVVDYGREMSDQTLRSHSPVSASSFIVFIVYRLSLQEVSSSSDPFTHSVSSSFSLYGISNFQYRSLRVVGEQMFRFWLILPRHLMTECEEILVFVFCGTPCIGSSKWIRILSTLENVKNNNFTKGNTLYTVTTLCCCMLLYISPFLRS